jgi:hypothetical protein
MLFLLNFRITYSPPSTRHQETFTNVCLEGAEKIEVSSNGKKQNIIKHKMTTLLNFLGDYMILILKMGIMKQ